MAQLKRNPIAKQLADYEHGYKVVSNTLYLYHFSFWSPQQNPMTTAIVTANSIDRVVFLNKHVYRLYRDGAQVAEFDADLVVGWVRKDA